MRRALFIAEFGKPRRIVLSNLTVLASATIGTAVGTASVVGGSVVGTASWSLVNNAGGKYAINSSTGAITVNGALAAGVDTIVVAVSGLTPAVKNATFSIGVVSAPVNSVLPVITGTAAVGFTLSSSTGTWSNGAYNTYTYQWKADASNIGGATNSTYVPVSGDTGKVITCAVTATNIAGNATATSAATSAVINTPANTVLPVISGSASPGQTVTTSNGTWSGSPSFTYQWKLDASPIVGQTASSYLVQAGDDTHTLTCTVTATNVVGSASATSTGVVVSTFPSGALGIWYADSFVSSPRPQIVNAQSVNAASTNLLTSSRRMFANTDWWNNYGAGTIVSIVDDAATAPDGTSQASTISMTGGWVLAPQNVQSGGNYAAGTYTMACSVKRNDVTDQPFAFTADNTATRDVHTATSAWQRFSFTFVKGATWTPQIMSICSSDGSTGAKLQICDFELFSGGSDLGPVALSGHLLLGSFAGDSRPTYSSGALDLATNSGYGLIQFLNSTTISSTGITMVALVSKTATNAWDGILSKVQTYTDFTGMAGINAQPYDFQVNTMASGGTSGLWDLKTLGGYHGITHRYDGTNRDLFIDDVRIWRKVSAVSDFTIRDFFCGMVNTVVLPCGLKISGIALWNRNLSDSEVRTAVAALQARATGNGLTATSVSRVLVAEGDSITALTSPVSYAYKFGANSSPFVIGAVYAVSGSTLADVNTRTAITDGIVPPSTVGRKFIFSCLLGPNDLSSSPPAGYASVSAWAAAYATMFAGRKSAGYTTVGITTLPSTAGSVNTNRAVGNPLIIAMQGTQTDATVDFGGDSVMGPDAAASNATLYGDGTHPTDTGMIDLEFQSGHTTTTYRPVINGI